MSAAHIEVSFVSKHEKGPGKLWVKVCAPGLNHETDFEGVKRIKNEDSLCDGCNERLPWVKHYLDNP